MPNLRALILDPSIGARNSAGPIRDLAANHSSWSWEQISFEETQVNPRPVMTRIRTALEGCDVLIGLGDFFLFSWLGLFADEYIQLVQDRMRSGMPAPFSVATLFRQP